MVGFKEQAKAIVAAITAAATGSGAVYLTVPDGVSVPWWVTFVIVPAANGLIGYVLTFQTPNTPAQGLRR